MSARTAHSEVEQTLAAIERFIAASHSPALIEPGEDGLTVTRENFNATVRGNAVVIECWSATRNLVRRVRRILSQRRGRIELEIERFGARTGTLTLADLADPANREVSRRGARLKYRERFRRSLLRQFPGWRIAELSAEPDLHNSLSPSFPRALLRKGTSAVAAIGASEDSLSPEGVLSFGLIWLDYLRKRESRAASPLSRTGGLANVESLAIFVPVGAEANTCHRVRYLDPNAARYFVFVHSTGADEDLVDPGDYTNFDTHVEARRAPLTEARANLREIVAKLAHIHGVETREHIDGSLSLAVRGLEFARALNDRLSFGIDHKHVAHDTALSDAHAAEIEQIARTLATMRASSAADHLNPLYTRYPESWIESQVRANIERIDATLLPAPVYGQVPQFAAGERGVIDLLATDRDGRLAILEIKATQDIQLPLQALDYWMRVKWHLERGEFSRAGYFPGIGLTRQTPRLLLVAPALEFHPSNEIVLAFCSPAVPVERIGIGIEWKRELRVMFRAPASTWHSLYFAKSNEQYPI